MDKKIYKLPRLYTPTQLMNNGVIALNESQAHYLFSVLRRGQSDQVRLFNGNDGEWLGELQEISKKCASLTLKECLIEQPTPQSKIHLLFSPIKKTRMEWLIEKAVELGVDELHPVITRNTQFSKLKEDRIHQQIIEASEQCERLTIPQFHSPQKLKNLLENWPKDIEIFSCLERQDCDVLQKLEKEVAVLIGPEGGFTAEEVSILDLKTTPVSLGKQILRSETAALKAVAIMNS